MDVFELSRHRGTRRRLFGPGQFQAVRSRSVAWGISIDSLTVGPQAYVRLFRSKHPEEALWLLPGQVVADLIEVKIGDEMDSLSIHDRAPRSGDPGFESYQAQVRRSRSLADSRS